MQWPKSAKVSVADFFVDVPLKLNIETNFFLCLNKDVTLCNDINSFLTSKL